MIMDLPQQPVYYKKENDDSFFRKRYTATISFAIGILLFLLPFVQLKCSSVTIAENSGVGLATGGQWNVTMMGGTDALFKSINASKSNSDRKALKIAPDWFLVLAIVFAIAGIIFSVSKWQMRSMAAMSAGILSAVMLIAAMVHLKILMKSQIPTGNKSDSLDFNMGGIVAIEFTIWYYLSLAAFAAAAFFSYKHHKIEEQDAINSFVDFEFQKKSE
jgi:protein-S-isoprenylcysteine O-methyltransferase Ste14